jgi:hypothetical protein
MSTTITVADILDALEQAQAGHRDPDIPPHTYSGSEICEAMRWGHSIFKRQMLGWLADGTCRVVNVRKTGLDGRLCNVRNYQFVKPQKFATIVKAKRGRAA